MDLKLLVDSEEFWTQLQIDIRSAHDCVYVQTLSFEGDSVGLGLTKAMSDASASDRRIIVDSFTKYIINDRFLYTPQNLRDRELRREVKQTKEMIADLRRADIQVKFSNPVGILLSRFMSRNHKKLIIIDDNISYIGGINFSEHNFDWHDMMLRIDNPEATAFLKSDFLYTWEGRNVGASRAFQDIAFHLFDGSTNQDRFRHIFDRIDQARRTIFIESPYLSFPFYAKLAQARDRGVEITIVSPRNNNKKSIGEYTRWESARGKFNLRLYSEKMTHLKAMLIDEEVLIMGSTNFDYLSYSSHQEIAAIVTAPDIIADFMRRVVAVDLAKTTSASPPDNELKSYLRHWAMKSLGPVSVFVAKR